MRHVLSAPVASAALVVWLAPASSAAQGAAPDTVGPQLGTEQGQEPSGARGTAGFGVSPIDGPPPPLPPDVIRRDERGRATIRAVELPEGIRLDGQLDERAYFTVPAITGFIQQAPDEGAPATERTEAWIFFDAANLYVAARIWDSAPPSEWVANELRRDTRQLRQNDTFAVILDTFYDRRNAVAFYTNPLGALADFQITNEGNPNSDWNPIWDVRTGRFEEGWTVEMEIPFQSLRYRPGPSQVWGVQLRRNVRRKNEWAYVTPLPLSAGSGPGGIFRVSDAATLVGLDAPSGSRNLEIKPYAIGGVSTNLAATPPTRNARDGDAGLDVKYGITQNLTADFTYNTDFAQVEVDEQQVNLTRFSLFFPEKREFFLEGRGIFGFARGGVSGGFGGALRRGGGGGFFGGGDAPTLFYSRRIGLQYGTVVPIVGGGRVTGKIGAFDIGALNIQTDDEVLAAAEETNFTVVRIRRAGGVSARDGRAASPEADPAGLRVRAALRHGRDDGHVEPRADRDRGSERTLAGRPGGTRGLALRGPGRLDDASAPFPTGRDAAVASGARAARSLSDAAARPAQRVQPRGAAPRGASREVAVGRRSRLERDVVAGRPGQLHPGRRPVGAGAVRRRAGWTRPPGHEQVRRRSCPRPRAAAGRLPSSALYERRGARRCGARPRRARTIPGGPATVRSAGDVRWRMGFRNARR